MVKEILMSEQARALYRPEFVEFMSRLQYAPDIIFSAADFDNSNPVDAANNHTVNTGFLEKVGVTNPQLQDHFLSMYAIETTGGDIGAYAWSEEFTALENTSRAEFEDLAKLPHEKAHEEILKLQFQTTVMNVVSASKSSDVHQFIANVTQIEKDDLNVDGISSHDVQAYTTMHEIAHLNQNPENMSRAEREWRAENFAQKTYATALQENVVSSANLPALMSQARAVGIFNNPHPDMHLTSSYAAISSAYVNVEAPNFEEMKAGFDKAFNQIISEVGRPFVTNGSEEEIFEEGFNLTKGQPELSYAAAKSLLLSGEFDDNLAGKALAENFVRGAESLSPDRFNVHGELYSDTHPISQDQVSPHIPATTNEWSPSPY